MKKKIKIAILISYFWEGAYVLNTLLKNQTHVELQLIVQAPWWEAKNTIFHYSIKYWMKYYLDFFKKERKYYSITKVARKNNIPITYVENINKGVKVLKDMKIDYLAVVGSRIIKSPIITQYTNRILNFHTGILPLYRGPYSEFWAMYNEDMNNIGTTIHILDAGIDTGNIIAQNLININRTDTPETAHFRNVKYGAILLSEVLNKLDGKEIIGQKQDEDKARYFSFPSDEQLEGLKIKIGKNFKIKFIE